MHGLVIENLYKRYKNGIVDVLSGINLSVSEGDIFGILGPNAAGKSTLIGIITSLVAKTSGKVIVFGHDIDKSRCKVKSCIGVSPQEINFNPVETVEYILIKQAGYYGIKKKNALEQINYLLERLDLKHKCHEQAKNLSGGYKRRLLIARALVHKPKMLILDEPTSGVDVETRRNLWKFFREINQDGTTIILITHYLEEVEHLCRNVAIIAEGKIVEQLSVNAIMKKLADQSFILHLKEPLNKKLINIDHKKIDEFTLEVSLVKEQSISDLINFLSTYGINVIRIRNKKHQLEEYFISITSPFLEKNQHVD